MYAHDCALAPLVRGAIDQLSIVREHCDVPEILTRLTQGEEWDALLPDHPLFTERGHAHSGKIFLACGSKIFVEPDKEAEMLKTKESSQRGMHLGRIDISTALTLLNKGGVGVLIGMDTSLTLRLAVLMQDEFKTASILPDFESYTSSPEAQTLNGRHLVSLREWAHYLDDDDAQSALIMTALAQWHFTTQYCAYCGGGMSPVHSGWVRQCTQCLTLEYPRQDPAVIMSVFNADDQILLAHNAAWAPRRVSVLAGFVDAGEAPENTVIREVWEEVGIRVDKVQALGTQPWPFPRSLMLAYSAHLVEGSDSTLFPCPEEIEWAQWYSRDDLITAVENGEIILPGRNTIAYGLIRNWFGAPLPLHR